MRIPLRPGMSGVPAPSDPSWFWRWGAPVAASGALLAAAGFCALWLSGSDVAGRAGNVAVAAVSFAATLLFCWIVGKRHSVAAPPALPSVKAAHRDQDVLAAVVVFAALVLAAVKLDGPVTYDELVALDSYGFMSLGEIATTYYDPNNHVLHTLAVRLAHDFGGHSLPVLRLPSFASFCLLLPVVWWFVRKEFGSTAAAFATAFVGTSPLVVEYATHARGHTLLLLLFMAALLCGRVLARKPDRNGLWAAWAAAIALGFYTMPLMGFPALTAAIWMLLMRWREGGRAAVRPFAVKTAAWSVAALAGAALLWAPIFAAEGVGGVHEVLVSRISGTDIFAPRGELDPFTGERVVNTIRGAKISVTPALLWLPFERWHAWHFKFPAWATGSLLALVVVGTAAPNRRPSLGVRALLLAAALAIGLLLLVKPFNPGPRLLLWTVPLVMAAAGVGAAFVLEQAAAWAGARWPRVVAAEWGRRTATWGVVMLIVGVFAFWSAQPGLQQKFGPQGWRLRALVSSVPSQMESGDYFTIFNWWATMAMLQMREHLRVDDNAGLWLPFGHPDERWWVHRIASAEDESHSSDAGTTASDADAGASDADAGAMASQGGSEGRLFVFYPRDPRDTTRTFPIEYLEAHPPDHELITSLDGGTVYVLNDWVKHP